MFVGQSEKVEVIKKVREKKKDDNSNPFTFWFVGSTKVGSKLLKD